MYTGWNKQQTIDNLLRKGGHKGQISPNLRSSIKVRLMKEQIQYSIVIVQATPQSYFVQTTPNSDVKLLCDIYPLLELKSPKSDFS